MISNALNRKKFINQLIVKIQADLFLRILCAHCKLYRHYRMLLFNCQVVTHSLSTTRKHLCVTTLTLIILSVHFVSKNDTDVAHYNFNTEQQILVIFGTYVAE